MKELSYPFDSAYLLKNRRKIKRQLLEEDGTDKEEDSSIGRFDYK